MERSDQVLCINSSRLKAVNYLHTKILNLDFARVLGPLLRNINLY